MHCCTDISLLCLSVHRELGCAQAQQPCGDCGSHEEDPGKFRAAEPHTELKVTLPGVTWLQSTVLHALQPFLSGAPISAQSGLQQASPEIPKAS